MKEVYIDPKDDLNDLKKEYERASDKNDFLILHRRAENFLLHSMEHLFSAPQEIYLTSPEWETKVTQYYLNLAIGLELILKSALLKNGKKISRFNKKKNEESDEYTIPFSLVIDKINEIKEFEDVDTKDLDEIKNCLRILNFQRNNFAHKCIVIFDSYEYPYRFSMIALFIYHKLGGKHKELLTLLKQVLVKYKNQPGMIFIPFKFEESLSDI